MTRAAIVIPFRDRHVDPLRQANLDHTRLYYEMRGWPVLVVDDGGSGADHFNRSRAYNRATTETDADVLCYIESDTLVPGHQLSLAVEWATNPGLVVPFSYQHKLDNISSHMVRGGADASLFDAETVNDTFRTSVNHGSACIVSRQTLRLAGQWDETFEGHGHDDTAMMIAFERTSSPTRYVPGNAYHLYHLEFDPGLSSGAHIRPEDAAAQERNARRLALYRQTGSKSAIRALTAGAVLQEDWRTRLSR